VAKKLIEIEDFIKERSEDFYQHLAKRLPLGVWSMLNILVSKTQVYLFSGVIRNYFIQRKFDKLRDVDFIISDELDIELLFPNLTINKNSFGGYKLVIESITIDLWIVKNTWALNQGQIKLPYKQLDHLPNTTFFNFSSIIFSLNNKDFTIGKPFLRFLKYKKIDVVFEENPYPGLCIVNSFYYSDKYHFKLSRKLVEYILANYEDNINDFENIQIKHFGEIIYEKTYLNRRINELCSPSLPQASRLVVR
jgi:hypothetical protein